MIHGYCSDRSSHATLSVTISTVEKVPVQREGFEVLKSHSCVVALN